MKNFMVVVFCIVLFIGVILTAFANMGGNSEPLQNAVKDYLESALHGQAEIGTLHNMQFFPTAKIHVSDIKVVRDEDKDPIFTVKEVQAAMSAWDVFTQSGKVKVINVQDLYARSGVLLQKEIYIKRLGIVDEKLDEAPYLYAEGKYGGRPLSLRVDMERIGNEDSPYYKTGDEKAVTLISAPLTLHLTIDNKSGRKLHIKDLKATLKGEKETLNLTADLIAQSSASMDNIYVEGSLSADDGTLIKPDLKIALGEDTPIVTGSITAEKASIKTISALVQFIQEINNIISEPSPAEKLSFEGAKIDMDLNIKDLISETGVSLGNIQTPIVMKDKTLTIGPLHGSLKESKLDGQIRLISEQNRKDSLKGAISLILGRGEYQLAGLGAWGGGLVNAVMPDLNPQEDTSKIQCAIANVEIDKGIADVKTLFLDTARVTLKGKGSYDVVKDKLDLTIKPKAKEVAIGSVASAVDISGTLSKPSFSPNLLDLGSTLGGLVLGVVNPAFFAFSMTDLGITEDHPCAEFIKE